LKTEIINTNSVHFLSFDDLTKPKIMIRTATAVWNGSGKEGNGQLTTGSNVLSNVPYNFRKRFEDEPGTNPEELVAAAHAGCFTMKLSFVLGEAGVTPETLETKCEITFEGGVVKKSHLIVTGKVPGISKEKFEEAVKKAEQTCPISNALKTEISSEATLS
jgi:osmotically inducible protein OsmC